MELYEFAVLGPDQTILAKNSVELESGKAAWAQVETLAWKFDDVSGLIKVTDSKGALVILTGVSSARHVTARPAPMQRQPGAGPSERSRARVENYRFPSQSLA